MIYVQTCLAEYIIICVNDVIGAYKNGIGFGIEMTNAKFKHRLDSEADF